jgi:hypothetical protein
MDKGPLDDFALTADGDFSPETEKGLAGLMDFTEFELSLGLNLLTVAMESLSGCSDEDGAADDRIDLPLGVIRFAVVGNFGIRVGSETSFGEVIGEGSPRPAPGLFFSARMGSGIGLFLG